MRYFRQIPVPNSFPFFLSRVQIGRIAHTSRKKKKNRSGDCERKKRDFPCASGRFPFTLCSGGSLPAGVGIGTSGQIDRIGFRAVPAAAAASGVGRAK